MAALLRKSTRLLLRVEHLHKVHSAGVAWPALSENCTRLLLRVEHFRHEWSRYNVDTVLRRRHVRIHVGRHAQDIDMYKVSLFKDR